MKTPKEEAIELVSKFQLSYVTDQYGSTSIIFRDVAKRCAIICVNEIIFNIRYYFEQHGNGLFEKQLNFYKDVKKEIENL